MPTYKPAVTVVLDDELLKRINDFRFDNRIENRSEAIRRLVELGLDAHDQQAGKPPKKR